MSNGAVYVAVNRANQMAYVGATRFSLKERIGNHLSVAKTKGSLLPFHRALLTYGIQGFDFAILDRCDHSLLEEKEIEWVTRLGSKDPSGYNLTDGGKGPNGIAYTDERREKIRISQLGDRNRMKNPETARKHGAAISGERAVWYGKFGPLHNRYGQHHKLSEETKARQRAAFNTPEIKESRRQSTLRRQVELQSPEVQAKRNASLKKHWNNPAPREISRQRINNIWSDPERRKIMCERMKEAWKARRAKQCEPS